jgi:glycosyltransferase involved in cell wall biosynthesis
LGTEEKLGPDGNDNRDGEYGGESPDLSARKMAPEISIALLTGGIDRHYVYGLTGALCSRAAKVDLIGSRELDDPQLRSSPGVNFLNLRGDQRPEAALKEKVFRIASYYYKLLCYAAKAKPRIFHILWNNRFETFDRTLLMLYYKFFGKRIVLTAHNVNADSRDKKDTLLNRITLRIQYRLADHIFVHTRKMKDEVVKGFAVREERVTVIPYGINNAVPETNLTRNEAREQLGLRASDKAILFFGRIKAYKGLECLIEAFQRIRSTHEQYRLIIAGRLEAGSGQRVTEKIQGLISEDVKAKAVLTRAEFIPDNEIEIYFKSADVLVLPYTHIYQSGVLFLGYSFGLPVLAADVGSLRDDIVESQTGFVFKSGDVVDLANTIERYFSSDLFQNLEHRRQQVREYAAERHSWNVVGQITMDVYARLLRIPPHDKLLNREAPKTSLGLKAPS